jgi:hypothetical protein
MVITKSKKRKAALSKSSWMRKKLGAIGERAWAALEPFSWR